MRAIHSWLVLAALAVSLAAVQDPKPGPSKSKQEPSPPAGQAAPAAQEPEKADADKPIPGQPTRHRWQGVYKLRSRVIRGQLDPQPSKGYLAITRKHMFLHLASPGTREDRPLLNSAVRSWRQVEDSMQMTSVLDYLTDSNGDIHLVTPGKQHARRIQLLRGGLRVYQDNQSWLEFERVE